MGKPLSMRVKIKLMFPVLLFAVAFFYVKLLAIIPALLVLLIGLNGEDRHELREWAREDGEEENGNSNGAAA